ncbi:hypothetical protein KW800_03245 [Candidatus Parcubacteria bacterium]|nr:hypothetical protein [Candidatus Parcubacteria bacterium]
MPEFSAKKSSSSFWIVVATLYFASIALSYHRVYIRHDYPVFTNEDQIPDVLLPVYKLLHINN